MNQEKLKKLHAQVRIGGKGTPRRKKKFVHVTAATIHKNLESSLEELSVKMIPCIVGCIIGCIVGCIVEVNLFKDGGTVIHFNNPKVQASLMDNTYAITGHGEKKEITEMPPDILGHLGPEGLNQFKKLDKSVVGTTAGKTAIEEDDEVPDSVENLDEASKHEVPKN